MLDTTSQLNHDSKQYPIRLGTVEQAFLGEEDHGIFTLMATLNFGGMAQGFGTYGLDQYDKQRKARYGAAYGMDHIMRVLEVAGVREWDRLNGRKLYAVYDHRDDSTVGQIIGIAGPDTGKVLIFKDHFDNFKPVPDEPAEDAEPTVKVSDLREWIEMTRSYARTMRELPDQSPNQAIINGTCAGGMDEVLNNLKNYLEGAGG